MMRRVLFPPGPFPPMDPLEPDTEDESLEDSLDAPDPETELVDTGAVTDLGASFRDQLYTGHHLDGRARSALQARLRGALESGDWNGAAELLTAWADTFSLSAMVDDANDQWSTEPDGWSLAVLARSAQVVGMALGWTPSPDGPWPWPDAASLRAAVGPVDPATDVVVRRHPLDGADRLATLLGLKVEDAEAMKLPEHVLASPEELVDRRAELAAGLADGLCHAVVLTGPPPQTPQVALARGELRMEGAAQVAVDRYGLAGLLAPDAPSWPEVRTPAPAEAVDGLELTAVLDATCDGALVPGPPGRLRRGEVDTVGVLLFVGPHPPVWVAPVAVHVLRGLNGQRTLGELAAAMDAPPDALLAVASELLSLGAATRL